MISVLAEIAAERRRQDEKWGVQAHAPEHWIAILTEEIGEAAREALRGEPTAALRTELIQVAAVAVAAIEHIEREALRGPCGAPSCPWCEYARQLRFAIWG